MRILEEKLDKEKLKQVFLKNPNAVVKYVIRTFLEKGVEPPEEFIEAISQGAYASKTYIDAIIHWTDKKVPQAIIQGVLKSSDIAFEIFQDPELRPHFSKEDLEKSIANNSSNALGLYKMYKKENKKIPMVIWKSITQSSTASLYLARDFVEARKTIPNQLLRGISTNIEKLFVFSIELLKNNLDLPDVFLNALSKHADSSRVLGDLDKVLFQYVKEDKEIPQILLDAAANRAWRDKNLSGLCYDLASKGMKIPDAILDIFIKNTPKSGYGYIGGEAFKIISYYLKKEAMTKFENIPTKLYKYISESGISNYIKILVEGFMKTFGKVPEEFKKAILDYHDKYSKREYIPQDIAKAIGINESKIIKEKLDKNELLNTVFDSWTDARSMIFDLSKMGKEIPDKLAILAVENMPASILKFVIEDIIAFGKNEVPEIMLKSISKDKKIRNNIAMVYKNYNQEIPKIIMDSLNSEQKEFYNSVWFTRKKPIEEKLDKNKLLDVVGSALDKSDILDFAFNLLHLGNELPDNILKIISDRPSWAVDHVKSIFSKNKIIDTKRKDLQILLKSLSEDVYQSGELIKFLLRMGRSDIPDVLLKSIAKNGLITKTVVDVYILNRKKIPIILQRTLEAFKQKHPLQAINLGLSVSESKKTITEKLDKSELLGVIQKDYDAYIDIMNHYFRGKNEFPPEEFLKMATETDEASRIFSEYCLEHKKDIPEDVIKKVAENPRSAYTIAALMILEEREVPEILIKSIHSNQLSLKHFKEFVKNEESRVYIPTSYYAKI